MIIAYIAISLMLGTLWVWTNEGRDFDELKPIFLTPAIMKELMVELNTTRVGSALFIGLFVLCNFFTLPWAFFGLVGKLGHKLLFKGK